MITAGSLVLSQPSGQVLLAGLAGPLRLTAANVTMTATGLRAPWLTAMITSGQLTASSGHLVAARLDSSDLQLQPG